MSKPILYANPISPHSNIVLAFLAAAGLSDKVEVKNLDVLKGEHKTESFLAINPCGQIGTLTDGETNVFESDAIIRYLAVKYDSDLYPVKDLHRFGLVESLQNHIRQKVWEWTTGLVFHKVFKKLFTGQEPLESDIAAKTAGLDKTLDFVATSFLASDGPYLTGDKLSIADSTLATAVLNAVKFGEYQIKNERIATFIKHYQAQNFYKNDPHYSAPQ
jgi:glutathione S-transferase